MGVLPMQDTNIVLSGGLVEGSHCPWRTHTHRAERRGFSGKNVAHEGHKHRAERGLCREQMLHMKVANTPPGV